MWVSFIIPRIHLISWPCNAISLVPLTRVCICINQPLITSCCHDLLACRTSQTLLATRWNISTDHWWLAKAYAASAFTCFVVGLFLFASRNVRMCDVSNTAFPADQFLTAAWVENWRNKSLIHRLVFAIAELSIFLSVWWNSCLLCTCYLAISCLIGAFVILYVGFN